MKVLIACEESQTVCKAFRKLGHEAYSCDLLECSGGADMFHLNVDALQMLKLNWDMIIAHPPCTYLTVTGNRWFNVEKYGDMARERYKQREDAIKFFMMFANARSEHIAIENPIGIMSTEYRKPDQIIQPYMFGDAFEKKTALWLKNLPALKPTNIVVPEKRKEFASGKTMPAWYADAFKLPKEERTRLRSKTFQGIADAMAAQWCEYMGEIL